MATDIEQVRLLIADTDAAAPVFGDGQIQTFLTLEGNVKRAAAQALDVLASNEALVSKVIKDRNLSTDGAKVSAELRARATSLREQADDDGDEFAFEIVEYDPYPDYPGFQLF